MTVRLVLGLITSIAICLIVGVAVEFYRLWPRVIFVIPQKDKGYSQVIYTYKYETHHFLFPDTCMSMKKAKNLMMLHIEMNNYFND